MQKGFFRSSKVISHWDTWIHFYNGKYYLYYLANLDDKAMWSGFGLAISSDGVSWDDYGIVLRASDKMVYYMGTGSVWKSPDFEKNSTFICNYSENQILDDKNRIQRILFATSKDLINWNKKDNIIFDVDEKYYKKLGRWDCIYALPFKDGKFLGTWTGTPNSREDGGIAFGYSTDGIHWNTMDNLGIDDTVNESGAIEFIDNKYIAMFGHGDVGMITYSSNNFNGPYEKCLKNNFFLSKYTYFSRFFYKDNELLVNHHAYGKIPNAIYFSPIKKPVFKEDSLWLYYWHGNDKLKKLGNKKKSDFNHKSCIFIEGFLGNNEEIIIGHGTQRTSIKYINKELIIFSSDENRNITREINFEESVSIIVILKDNVFEVYFDEVYMASHSLPDVFNGSIKGKNIDIYEVI